MALSGWSITPEALAKLVNEGWLILSDRGITAAALSSDESRTGFHYMRGAIQYACDAMRADGERGFVTVGRSLSLMDAEARQWFAAQMVYELVELGFQWDEDDDDD